MAVLRWEGRPRQEALEHSLSNDIKDALASGSSLPPENESYGDFVARF